MDHRRRIRLIQTLTIAWMMVEAAIALWAAWRAQSPALLAFGGDSAIELLSAVVVLWSLQPAEHAQSTKNVNRIAGGLLLALAAFVATNSAITLAGHREPAPTLLGIGILIAAALVMPLLAREKRKLSGSAGSAALRADAAQSSTCAYLSVIALTGLAANALWRVRWADPAAALAIVPFVLWEARETFRGKPCGCC